MKLTGWKALSSLAVAAMFCPLLAGQTNPARQPIARIGEAAVYEDDLLASIGGPLMQLKTQEYELKMKALNNLVSQRLLEAEAKSRGVSAEAFLGDVVDRNVAAPGAGEVEAYYLAQKDRLNRPLDEIRPQVEEALTQARRQQARQDYIDRMREKGSVAIMLTRPKVEVSPDLRRLRGDAAAPITIVEFADFQCPYCQQVQQTVAEVIEKYAGKVRLSFRDFPLRQIHSQAQGAAEAARCAGEQGKFWAYHDALYTAQSKLDAPGLTEHARATGLDAGQFAGCLASGKSRQDIENDLQAGMASGVTGTPAFYINGVLLTGTQPFSAFASIIDSELARLSSNRTAR